LPPSYPADEILARLEKLLYLQEIRSRAAEEAAGATKVKAMVDVLDVQKLERLMHLQSQDQLQWNGDTNAKHQANGTEARAKMEREMEKPAREQEKKSNKAGKPEEKIEAKGEKKKNPFEATPAGTKTMNDATVPINVTTTIIHSKHDVKAMLPITFTDAIGRRFKFPWHLCKKWKVGAI
jgi:hypothetical protein